MTEITMPSLSDSMQEGTILSWLKEDGERIAVGDELLEIETDKATMTYESPAEGTLRIVATVGQTLPVGAPIAHLGVAGEADDDGGPVEGSGQPAATQPVEPAELEPSAAAPAPTASGGNGSAADVRATPLARRLAREHGVELGELQGSGPRGRITRADVADRAGVGVAPAPARGPTPSAAGPTPPAPVPTPSAPDRHSGSDARTQPLSRRQQLIARRMAEAKATIPHFQVQTEAEVDALLGLRAELKRGVGEQQLVPSVNDFIVKACALALRKHPRANGSYREGSFELHQRINVGVAVAAEDSLIVPTIFDADERSLGDIAAESRRLAERVRDGTVTPPELSGATFTVSNLGMFGMTAITPVINPPQAAILGVGAARALPELVDGGLVSHHLLTLTLSCDHRILYGADAARFLSDIRLGLQTPLALML
ncbi:MAG TPA: dihydrolipoamide acetyltransferase family protein [Solirubrobacteraceae bacterium]